MMIVSPATTGAACSPTSPVTGRSPGRSPASGRRRRACRSARPGRRSSRPARSAVARCHVEDPLVARRSSTPARGPDSCRGAASPRAPSCSLCIHSISPVPASSDTTARRDAGRREDPAVDHQRRRLEVVFRPRAQAVGLEPPRDLEVVEVVAVDLVERRVAGVAEIAAIGRPFAVARAGLPCQGRRRRTTHRASRPRSARSEAETGIEPPPYRSIDFMSSLRPFNAKLRLLVASGCSAVDQRSRSCARSAVAAGPGVPAFASL